MKKTLQSLFFSMLLVLIVLCTFIVLIIKTDRKENQINFQIDRERLFLSACSDFQRAAEEIVIAARGYFISKDPEIYKNYQLSRLRVTSTYNTVQQFDSYKLVPLKQREQLHTAFINRVKISDSITALVHQSGVAGEQLSRLVLEGNNYSNLLSQSVHELTKQGIAKIELLEQQSSGTPQIKEWLLIVTVIIFLLALIIGFLYLLRSSKAKIRAQEQLKSYRQSHHFLNSLSEGIVVQDKTGSIIECNAAAAQILGLTIDQMQGRTSIDPRWRSIHEDGTDFPGHEHPSMQVLSTGMSMENIIMGVHKPGGALTWILINSHPVKNSKDGVVSAAVTGFTDITEYKKQEDLIKQSEFLMKSSMNTIKEGFHMIDRSYNAVLVNQASKILLQNITGSAPDIGDNVVEFLPAERKKAALQILERVFAGEAVEYEVLYHINRPVWILYSMSPVTDQNSHIQYACIMFKDITAQKEKVHQIKEDEERLRMALERTGDNAWEHNFHTGITWFSSNNNQLLGYSAEELNIDSNKNYWWRQTHPDDRHLLEKNDQEYKSGSRGEHSMEYRIHHKNGSLRWVLDRGVVIEWDASGKPIRIVGTHTDISKEKQLQQQLLKQEQQKKKEIVEAVIQAQEKEREEIAQELHEDIAQVLSSVKMLLTAADKNILPAGKAAVELSNERITGVVDEIRLISQNINSSTLHQVGLKNAVLDIISHAEIVSSIQFEYQSQQYDDQKKAEFTIELTMLRLFQAMIKNIVRHSEATTAKVELFTDDLHLHLSVKDNGKGFLLSDAIKGLGIQTIINRAEQYGGHVHIESNPGQGCLIQVTLPLLHAA
jgi:PAS domain S-box-containing protein